MPTACVCSTADADLRARMMAEPPAGGASGGAAAAPTGSGALPSSPVTVPAFIRLAEAQGSHPLDSLLAMPVQRVPRYLLLLKGEGL